METTTLQTILNSDDFLYVYNTMIGIIFILSVFTAIQAASKLKSSGASPTKRSEAKSGVIKAAVFFFIDGLLMTAHFIEFAEDFILGITVFQTDAILGANKMFETLVFLTKVSAGFTFLSIVGALIAGFITLAAGASNPKMRQEAMKGILYTLLSAIILGSITTFMIIFIKIGNVGGV